MAYTDFNAQNVQFLQGTQAQLNLYFADAPNTIPAGLPNAGSSNTFKGNAKNGAFYLTTDTQRLYVGRKVEGTNNVYPELVSAGITTVANASALSSLTTNVRDGDIVYISSDNILAVYEAAEPSTGGPFPVSGGKWVQINAATSMDSLTTAVGGSVTNGAVVTIAAKTKDGKTDNESKKSDTFTIQGGTNVTITKDSTNKTITIASANSQSDLGIEVATDATNKAPIVLSDGVNLDTKVYFAGANDTTIASAYSYIQSTDTSVNAQKTYYSQSGTSPNYTYTAVVAPTGNPSTSGYYEKQDVVTVTGPGVQGVKTTALGTAGNTGTAHGFELVVPVQNGGTNTTNDKKYGYVNASNTGLASRSIDPKITYGTSGSSSTYFHGGEAVLDVLTSAQTSSLIDTKVDAALQTADALHFKGAVADAAALTSLTDADSVSIGDVYKASGSFNVASAIQSKVSAGSIKTGDLLIATSTNGTEDDDGYIAAANIKWEVIPSGDEPWVGGAVSATSAASPFFEVQDKNNSPATTLLKVTFDNTDSANNLIEIKSKGTTSATDFKLEAIHKSVTRTDTTNSTLSSTDSDSVSSGKIKFFALDTTTTNNSTGIVSDSCGHITAVKGKVVTLQHNYLTALTATPSISSSKGQIVFGANDVLGITQAGTNLTKATVKFSSDTLTISKPSGTTDELAFNLVWGAF